MYFQTYLKFRVRYLTLSERSHLTYHCPPRLSSSLGSTCFGFPGLTSHQPTFISHSHRLLVNTVSLSPNTIIPRGDRANLTDAATRSLLTSTLAGPRLSLGSTGSPSSPEVQEDYLCSCMCHVSLLRHLDPHNLLGPILGHSDLYNPFQGVLSL